MPIDLPPNHFHYLSTASDPVLEILGESGTVDRIPLSTHSLERDEEKLWTADLGRVPRSDEWQFRVALDGSSYDRPSFAPFYTSAAHTLWLQDHQVFTYRPARHLSPARVEKIQGFSGSLPARDLYVYLPRGYDEHRARRYPVLYMHDGQNCFDAHVHESYVGSWQADLTANLLTSQGLMRECVIVGISHGKQQRVAEYLPPYAVAELTVKSGAGRSKRQATKTRVAGHADRTVAYYRDEVAPAIGRRYRVLGGRDHAATCGSSMGGLFSLYMAWEHPQFARQHAVMSPSLWMTRNPDGTLEAVERLRRGQPRDLRLWLDSGSLDSPDGGDDGMDDTQKARDALLENGYVEGVDFHYFLDEGATHSEYAWAARLPLVFQFLFPVAP
jgi:predicted alpha/beta superfamily hydrolase